MPRMCLVLFRLTNGSNVHLFVIYSIILRRFVECVISEGIPMTQQHLVMNSIELLDDVKIMDYKLKNGDTIQLIPAMRGGPVNLRRGEFYKTGPIGCKFM